MNGYSKTKGNKLVLFLLDTNAFSDLMAAQPKVKGRVAGLATTDEIVICSIVRGEILYGIELLPPGRRRSDLDEKARCIFAAVACRPVPIEASDSYSNIKFWCKGAGLVLNDNDLWIAATAITLNATLVTRDRDFSRVKNLVIEDWPPDLKTHSHYFFFIAIAVMRRYSSRLAAS